MLLFLSPYLDIYYNPIQFIHIGRDWWKFSSFSSSILIHWEGMCLSKQSFMKIAWQKMLVKYLNIITICWTFRDTCEYIASLRESHALPCAKGTQPRPKTTQQSVCRVSCTVKHSRHTSVGKKHTTKYGFVVCQNKVHGKAWLCCVPNIYHVFLGDTRQKSCLPCAREDAHDKL